MIKKSNLRFLLSLGGQKVVIMQEQDQLRVYTREYTDRPNVSAARLSEAVQFR
ncbi:MAG: hypothetical protein J6U96_05495 [Elusimicrobiaceae bacterium]|nr:hypothetical protein [Elusimicrobiaceae bacterium]